MRLLRLYALIIFYSFYLIESTETFCQNNYPKDYFGSPVDIPILLAGNFGEIRSGHFHAGLDIKTDGVEGQNIIAAGEGFIRRIKIQQKGYGKVLYLEHPNGYTTTYAHLQKFSEKIEKYVKQQQYDKESFFIELFPEQNALKIEKGEIIAISGNTGGSGGPHLHFEIRKTNGDIPVNPLLFGFDIKDNVPPKLMRVGIYTLSDSACIAGEHQDQIIPLIKSGTKYKLKSGRIPKLSGRIGFGIESQDFLNYSSNKCGVYSVELFVDSNLIYKHEMNEIPFHETRFINAHCDYHNWYRNNAKIQRSYKIPHNKLSIYQYPKQGDYGWIFNENKLYNITYVVKDAYNNRSTVEFQVEGSEPGIKNCEPLDSNVENHSAFFKYDEYNSYEDSGIVLSIPPGLLYNDLGFKYSRGKKIKGGISPVHNIHDLYTPLHSYMTLSIKTDSLPLRLFNKAYAVSLDSRGNPIYEGGKYNDGYVTVKSRSFGPYCTQLDTISPEVKPHNFRNNQIISSNSLTFKIYDDQSGIGYYEGKINGKWALFEYEYKNGTLTYFFDKDRLEPGKHEIQIYVQDKCLNSSKRNYSITWKPEP